MAEDTPAGPTRHFDLGQQLSQMWRQGQRPDVYRLLADAGDLQPGQVAAVLAVDQRERWRAGKRVAAEDYLRAYPALQADVEAALELVYAEVLLREELGEAPALDEYLARFPQYAARLAEQFQLHWALAAGRESAEGSAAVTVISPAAGRDEVLPRVPGYEVLAELGRGGMGVVYKAWQAGLGRMVALKVMLSGAHAGPQELARFRVEGEAVARLQHPNIVQVHDVGEQGGRPYLVMEFADGGSLADKLDGTPWPGRDAARLVETLARAVAYAHQRGVLHRDLKPANILLTADGTPKLSDFGLARLLVGGAPLTATGAVLGTPSYMAPEQAAGRPPSPAADVYGLGALLYELLTGRPPFKAATPLETLLQVRTEEPPPPSRLQSKVPRDLETVCLHCLHKAPGRRYASAADLADELVRFQAGEPVRARPVGPLGRLGRWARRNPAVAGLLAAVAVLLVGGSGVTTALWLEARASARQARQDRDRAEENFRLTLRAVEEYLTRVGDSDELRAYGLEKLRQSLLETANTFYQRFVEERGDDPQLQDELGNAYGRLAYISAELGEFDRAAEQYGRMRDVFAARAAAHPDDPRARQQLALAFYNLSDQNWRLGRWDEGHDAGREALGLRERLAAAAPESDEAAADLAASHAQLASHADDRGRWDDAEAGYLEARRLQAGLCDQHPTATHRSNLAYTWNNLGVLYRQVGRQKDAEAAFTEARTLRERLRQEQPGVARHAADLAETLINLGIVLTATARTREALSCNEAAHDLLSELTHAHPYVVRYRASCAKCDVDLADLYVQTREPAKAERACGEARALFTELARQRPDLPEYSLGLSQALGNLSVALNLSKRPAEAAAPCAESVEILEALCRRHGRVPEYQQALARGLLNLGAIHYAAGRYPAAATAWHRAAGAAKALCDDNPGVPACASVLADCYNNAGAACLVMGQPDESEADYKQGLAVRERLWHDHPDTAEYAIGLADTCSNLADLDLSRARYEAAAAWCDRGLPPLEELLRKAADDPLAKQAVCTLLRNRGVARSKLNRPADALDDFDRAARLAASGERTVIRAQRAAALARAGQHARAAAEADELAPAKDLDGEACYNLACVWTIESAGGGKPPPAAEQLAARAVEWLARAAAAGYFRTADNRSRLEKETDIDPLRARADFKTWLAGVGKEAAK